MVSHGNTITGIGVTLLTQEAVQLMADKVRVGTEETSYDFRLNGTEQMEGEEEAGIASLMVLSPVHAQLVV
jgi:hypothetical protein